MHTSPKNYSIYPEIARGPEVLRPEADERGQRTAGRVYQFLTVAAMLWLLASLWVF
jgi:hypothetical protein